MSPEPVVPTVRLRQAVVTAVDTGPPPTVTLTMDGASVGPIRHWDSVAPAVNDTVWVLVTDSDRQVVGRLAEVFPGAHTERIATTIGTSDSSGIGTTETTVRSVTAALVDGRTYRVHFRGQMGASTNGNDGMVTIREDSASGTILQQIQYDAPGLFAQPDLEAEYTASATGDKTFVLTLDLVVGTGSVLLKAASTQPDYLYVDYIRG